MFTMFRTIRQAACLCHKSRFYFNNQQISNLHMQSSLRRHEVSKRSRNLYIIRTFQTTSIHKAAPLGPILVKLMAPIYRLFFLFAGRRFRKWWSALPPERKAIYLHKLTQNRSRLLGVSGLFGGMSVGYYVYHLEETPITGRRRFMLLNNEQTCKVVDAQTRLLTDSLAKARLPHHDPLFMRVYCIMSRIFQANNLNDVNLQSHINVIVCEEANAFVLADGQIFVFTGMMNATRNDHELAGILGHELAHALLSHSAEQLSRSGFINIFSIIMFTLLWAVVPTDGLSILASWLQGQLEDILISLPYSRKLEKEADEIGMMLAAKACFDVTHIPKFWERMHIAENTKVVEQMDWLSTHPSHEKRVNWLNEQLPKALEIRDEMKCPSVTSFLEVLRKGIFG